MTNKTYNNLLNDFKQLANYFCTVVEGDDVPDGAYPLLRKWRIVDENDERIYEED